MSRDIDAETPIPKGSGSRSARTSSIKPSVRRGGKRAGAGRPPGSKTKKRLGDLYVGNVPNSRLPKDVLATKMQYYDNLFHKFVKSRSADRRHAALEALDKAADAAAILAQYVHAKLQATAAFGDGDRKGTTAEAQKQSLDRIIDKFERMAGAVDKGLPVDPAEPVSQPDTPDVAGGAPETVPPRTH